MVMALCFGDRSSTPGRRTDCSHCYHGQPSCGTHSVSYTL